MGLVKFNGGGSSVEFKLPGQRWVLRLLGV